MAKVSLSNHPRAADKSNPPLDDFDVNRAPPTPDLDRMLYGLVGDIARAGAQGTEANPVAIMMNTLGYLSAMVGRNVYLPVGDTFHHARLYSCHVGRTSEGRKGEAMALPRRLHRLIEQKQAQGFLGQVHNGGLSTAEGLVRLIHDGFGSGGNAEPPIRDKRLLIEEAELGNTLTKLKRPGNGLSAALRTCWDGTPQGPAVKHNKISAKDPHVAIISGITPEELRDLMSHREIANGFANRFMFIWAERTCRIALPKPLAGEQLQALAERLIAVIAFAKGRYPDEVHDQDTRAMRMTEAAETRYTTLYAERLNAPEDCPIWANLLQRRAPMLLRLAMLFALTDQQLAIEVQHLDAASAWITYWEDSVRFIFGKHEDLGKAARTKQWAENILEFLAKYPDQPVSRQDLVRELLGKKAIPSEFDDAITSLLLEQPPRIRQSSVPRTDGRRGRPRKVYQWLP